MPTDTQAIPTFKVVLVGEARAGKTALLKKYFYDQDVPQYAPTLGLDFDTVTTQLDKQKVKVNFWEVAGAKTAHGLVRAYLPDANVVLGVIDMRDANQLKTIEHYYNEMTTLCRHNPRLILVGTHGNEEFSPKIKESDLQALAEKWKCEAHCVDIDDPAQVANLFKRVQECLLQKSKKEIEPEKKPIEESIKAKKEPEKVASAPAEKKVAEIKKIVPPEKKGNREIGFLLTGALFALFAVLTIGALQAWPLLVVKAMSVLTISQEVVTLLAPFVVASTSFLLGASVHLMAGFLFKPRPKKIPVPAPKPVVKQETSSTEKVVVTLQEKPAPEVAPKPELKKEEKKEELKKTISKKPKANDSKEIETELVTFKLTDGSKLQRTFSRLRSSTEMKEEEKLFKPF